MDEKVEVPYDQQLSELVEQFCQECREGEAPDIDDYARRHPELAEDIRRIFPSLVVLERAGMGKPEGVSIAPMCALVIGRLARELGREPEELGQRAPQAVEAILEEPQISPEELEAAALARALPRGGDPLGAVLSVRIERALTAGRRAAAEEHGGGEDAGSFVVLLLRRREEQVGEETCVGLAVAQIEERLLAARGTPSGSSSFLVLADGASLRLLREMLAEKVDDSPIQVAFLSRPRGSHLGPPAEVEVVPIEDEIDGLESRLARLLESDQEGDGAAPAEGQAAADDDPLIGTLFHGKYRILRLIGSGGFGAVYEARDERGAGNRVAIKVLRPERAQHPVLLDAFRAEARRVTRLSHANVVDWKVFDQTEDGTEYFVMELVAGEELDKVLRREKRLEPQRVANTLLGVLDALRAAHSLSETESILHLDLKPHNVFLIPGRAGRPERVKVIDFGIGQFIGGEEEDSARAKEREDTMLVPSGLLEDLPEIEGEAFNPTTINFARRPGLHVDSSGVRFQRSIACTPEYASPEQTAHVLEKEDLVPLDGRSDLFSMGVMGFLMLTGELPFERSYSRLGMLQRRLEEDARRTASTGVKVPRPLARFVDRCMERDREKRFRDANEAYEALHRIVHPPVWQTVAKVVVPVVVLAALALWKMSSVQGATRVELAVLDSALDLDPAVDVLYLGPERPELALTAKNPDEMSKLAGADAWRLVSPEDGEPLAGWSLEFATDRLLLRGPVGEPERLDERARLRPQGANLGFPDLRLVWLGADAWSLGAITIGGKDRTALGGRAVDPATMDLELTVTGEGQDDLASVTIASAGGLPVKLNPAPGGRYRTRLDSDLELHLAGKSTTLALVLLDKAGREVRETIELPLAEGPLGLVLGEPLLEGCSRVGGRYRITPRNKDKAVLCPTFNRPADLSWWVEITGGAARALEGDAAEKQEHEVGLEGLADLASAGHFRGFLHIEADEGAYVLHADERRAKLTESIPFDYTTALANFSVQLMGAGDLTPGEVHYTRSPTPELIVARSPGTAVPMRIDVDWTRDTEKGKRTGDLSNVLAQSTRIRLELEAEGAWTLRVRAFPYVDNQVADEPETERSYVLVLDQLVPVLSLDGLEEGQVLGPEDLEAELAISLADEPGGATGSPVSVTWQLRDGDERVVRDGFLGGGNTLLPVNNVLPGAGADGTYRLMLTARDEAGNEALLLERGFDLALQPPELGVDLPRGTGVWQPAADDRWPLQVTASDPNGVQLLEAEILSSRDQGPGEGQPVLLVQGPEHVAPRIVGDGSHQFGDQLSEGRVWIRLTAEDRFGRKLSQVFGGAEGYRLPTIVPPRPPHVRVSDHDLGGMWLVAGNDSSTYTFGGRDDSSENRSFADAGLQPFFVYSRRTGSWSIKYEPGEIADFYCDEREVRRDEYLAFVLADERGYLDPGLWPEGSSGPVPARHRELEAVLAEGNLSLPVTGVTWEEASAFARWVGKRLPSFVEWEYTVRGGGYRVWAGGGVAADGDVVISASAARESGAGRDETPDTHVRELSGNVAEWTSSPISFVPGEQPRDRGQHAAKHRLEMLYPGSEQESATDFWIVGGSFQKDDFHCFVIEGKSRTRSGAHVGFRCVLSLEAVQEGLTDGIVVTER